MKLGLRTKLVGTLVGAIVHLVRDQRDRGGATRWATDLQPSRQPADRQRFDGIRRLYSNQKRDTVKLLVSAAINEAVSTARHPQQEAQGYADRDRPPRRSLVPHHRRTKGHVLARGANGGPPGAALNSPFVKRALGGETITQPRRSRTTSSPRAARTTDRIHRLRAATAGEGWGSVAAARSRPANGRTIGAV